MKFQGTKIKGFFIIQEKYSEDIKRCALEYRDKDADINFNLESYDLKSFRIRINHTCHLRAPSLPQKQHNFAINW